MQQQDATALSIRTIHDPPQPSQGLGELWKAAAERTRHGVVGLAKANLGIDADEPQVVADRLAICEQFELSLPQDKPVKERKCGKLLDLHGKGCGCRIDKKTRVAGENFPINLW
jgi:hypothetical protein